MADGKVCGWWVGPIWKLDGETCVCSEPEGHEMPHRCNCGSWFEGCGRPKEVLTHE
jgi:hypothetical protein